MKTTKRTAFNCGGIHLIICLCGIFLINLLALPCFGIGTGYSEPVFSVTSVNEPLSKALDKISKATGYKIEITNGWGNKQLTANLQDLTLDEGLERIIKAVGNPNHAIQRNDRTKKVEIKILDTAKGLSTVNSGKVSTGSYAKLQQKQTEAVLNNMDTPSQEQNESAAGDSSSDIDPLDMEVIPPDNPGEKGVTVRDLQEQSSQPQEQVDPLDIEVIPPDKPGGKGITARELEEAQGAKN